MDDGQIPRHDEFRKSLRTRHGVVIALANISPTVSIGIGLGFLAAVAGTSLPAAFLLAALPILAVSGGYARLAARDPNCGTAYVWVRRALGPWTGYLTGWTAVATNIMFLSYAGQLTGQFTLQLAHEARLFSAESTLAVTLTGLLWTGLIVVGAVRGVKGATAVQSVLLGLSAVVVLTVVVTAFARGDAAPVQPSWFSPLAFPDPLTLLGATVLAAYMFWGWESAFSVVEENAEARSSGRAGLIAIVVTLVLFLIGATGFLHALTPGQLADPLAGITELSRTFYGTGGAIAATTAMLAATVACMQSSVIAGSRLTLAMGRDGVLGPGWARLHPTRNTPVTSTLRTAGIAVALSLAGLGVGELSEVVLAVVNSVGILVSLMYGIGGWACAVTFRHELRGGRLRDILAVGVLPALGGTTLLLLGGLVAHQQWTSVDHMALDPENGRFLTALPLGTVLLGVPAALWTRYRRRAAYFTRPAPPLAPASASRPAPPSPPAPLPAHPSPSAPLPAHPSPSAPPSTSSTPPPGVSA
ncbi:APC family permease [Streptomyces sp. HNM0645]|uniref:APC family permease n=1 Tax=Streptomyces sp. HNM0645 TaxID=2782343 RepID=UPI0024B75705|nr:APC family permease [Streptomyces sp. HNM0645]MDI9887025.1 APC family permease [Streptomyces sp. HNM0645]